MGKACRQLFWRGGEGAFAVPVLLSVDINGTGPARYGARATGVRRPIRSARRRDRDGSLWRVRDLRGLAILRFGLAGLEVDDEARARPIEFILPQAGGLAGGPNERADKTFGPRV